MAEQECARLEAELAHVGRLLYAAERLEHVTHTLIRTVYARPANSRQAALQRVAVCFAEQGFVGIKFWSRSARDPPVIKALTEGGLAAREATLCEGLVLASVQGVSVAGIPFKEAMQLLRSASRPLRLTFKYSVAWAGRSTTSRRRRRRPGVGHGATTCHQHPACSTTLDHWYGFVFLGRGLHTSGFTYAKRVRVRSYSFFSAPKIKDSRLFDRIRGRAGSGAESSGDSESTSSSSAGTSTSSDSSSSSSGDSSDEGSGSESESHGAARTTTGSHGHWRGSEGDLVDR